MALVELLGDKLKSKEDGEIPTSSICGDGKFVGLYFSAHWCPPCRAFTPELAKFYTEFKEKTGNLEIVFVSSDQSEDQFDEYYGEMPWLALPYNLRDKKNEVSKKFKVQGIPMFIILDSQSEEVACKDGRSEVGSDPEGKNFPWKPRPFSAVIPGNFIDKEMKTVTMESLKDTVLGIYFSAHWCPPCRKFTPELVSTYNKVRESGKSFEIIFASRDRTQESFKEYFDDMPWLAFPFGDERVGELAKLFAVSGIPTLAIMDAEGQVITTEGRGRIMKDPEGKEFPWHPPPCYELDSFSAGIINEEPCLILFTDIEDDDEEETIKKSMELMRPIAEKVIAAEKEKGKEPACKFIVAGDDDMVESLQQFLSIADESLPLLALLDIPEQRVSHCEGKEITGDLIHAFYTKFTQQELQWTSLGN